nr:MAG TPA: hypothetical protein [Caudoviricetes sp.]
MSHNGALHFVSTYPFCILQANKMLFKNPAALKCVEIT